MTAVAAPSPISILPDQKSSPASPHMRPTIHALQLGVSWFPEHPGGVDRYFGELLKHLPEAGVIGRGIVMGSDRAEKESAGNVIVAAPRDSSLWTRWMAMRRVVTDELSHGRVSLVVSHHSLYTAPVLSLIKALPMVVHFHGPFAAESSAEDSRRFIKNAAKHLMERTVYSRAVLCITLSKAFANILHESYGVPRERIRIVPGAVETARFDPPETRPQARQRLNWPTDRPIAFSVRRLHRRMGLENLIEAVRTVRERVPDILVMIAGTGWMANELRQQLKAANLEDHVRLIGFIPDTDLPVAYRAADLTVVPSVSLEGFGLTTVESLAVGTPAIVTPVGGSPEVVGGLSADLIVPDWTPTALAAAITAAFRGELKLPSADECRDFARKNFDWATVTQKVRAVYDEALANSHPEAA
jgi:glycogen(starch) synthase